MADPETGSGECGARRSTGQAEAMAFDAYRARVLALPEAIAAASGERREELCRIVVERVVVRDRQLESIEWTPPARLNQELSFGRASNQGQAWCRRERPCSHLGSRDNGDRQVTAA